MSIKTEKAAEFHANGYNCAQAVIGAFSESLGLDERTTLQFAGSFGGGLRVGEVGGAASGGAMAIGIRYGQTEPHDLQTKIACGKITAEFMDEFNRRMGALRCHDLLGYDMRDAAAKQKYGSRNKEVCPGAITCAVEILEEMGF